MTADGATGGEREAAADAGRIVILNGTPRSGKSSIAAALGRRGDGIWLNPGVDAFGRMTPERYRPGIGLRPGGEAPDLEPAVALLYRALYDTIAAFSRLGLNVAVDVGHHDDYSRPLGLLADCARRLGDLPALLVGVRCPVEVVMARRRATWGVAAADDGTIPAPVRRWQEAVHTPAIYDLEVDTSVHSPEVCADAILRHLADGPPPAALRRLAADPAPDG